MRYTKTEYIAKYGEEAWEIEAEKRREYRKQWYQDNKEYFKQYYNTNKEHIAEYIKQYREANKKHIAEQKKQYKEANKERIAEWNKQYYNTNKERIAEQMKQWREANRDSIAEYNKQYYNTNKEYFAEWGKQHYQDNKEFVAERMKQYQGTQRGRANHLKNSYIRNDFNKGFPVNQNIDDAWIIENIFGSQCIYCGDSDWTHLGADRIDNTKGHTPDNCVCACGVCNAERSDMFSVEEFKEYRKTHPRQLGGDIEKSWEIVEQNGVRVIKKKEVI